MRSQTNVLLAGAILSAATVLMWPQRAKVTPQVAYGGNQRSGTPPAQAVRSPSLALGPRALQTSTSTQNVRLQFSKSRDYAEFVRGLSEGAAAGDPMAEYLTAGALKYCHDNAHWRVQIPDGSLRTRNELEIRVGKYPLSLQQEILDSYDRCQGFSQESGQADATRGWASWLDKASAAGYPPAQSLKAEDYWALSSAWGLLACQRGYDGCGVDVPVAAVNLQLGRAVRGRQFRDRHAEASVRQPF